MRLIKGAVLLIFNYGVAKLDSFLYSGLQITFYEFRVYTVSER